MTTYSDVVDTKEFTNAADRWLIPIPAEAQFASVLQLYDETMDQVEWPYKTDEETVDGQRYLVVDLKFELHTGFVKYQYLQESTGTGTSTTDTVITDGANVVNITVNQTGGAPSGATFSA